MGLCFYRLLSSLPAFTLCFRVLSKFWGMACSSSAREWWSRAPRFPRRRAAEPHIPQGQRHTANMFPTTLHHFISVRREVLGPRVPWPQEHLGGERGPETAKAEPGLEEQAHLSCKLRIFDA